MIDDVSDKNLIKHANKIYKKSLRRLNKHIFPLLII